MVSCQPANSKRKKSETGHASPRDPDRFGQYSGSEKPRSWQPQKMLGSIAVENNIGSPVPDNIGLLCKKLTLPTSDASVVNSSRMRQLKTAACEARRQSYLLSKSEVRIRSAYQQDVLNKLEEQLLPGPTDMRSLGPLAFRGSEA